MAKFRSHAKLLAKSGRKYRKNLSLSIPLLEEAEEQSSLTMENFSKKEMRMLRKRGRVGC